MIEFQRVGMAKGELHQELIKLSDKYELSEYEQFNILAQLMISLSNSCMRAERDT